MNKTRVFLSGLLLLIVSTSARAQVLYGATLNATLSTENVSGSEATITSVPVNNRTIASALFNSGTVPNVLKESDLALVFNEYLDLMVINTSATNSVVATIAMDGTNALQSSIESTSKKNATNATVLIARQDYEFTLPNVATTQVTNLRLTAKEIGVAQAVSGLSLSFSGGNLGTVNAGATLFQGTLKQTSKTYSQ